MDRVQEAFVHLFTSRRAKAWDSRCCIAVTTQLLSKTWSLSLVGSVTITAIQARKLGGCKHPPPPSTFLFSLHVQANLFLGHRFLQNIGQFSHTINVIKFSGNLQSSAYLGQAKVSYAYGHFTYKDTVTVTTYMCEYTQWFPIKLPKTIECTVYTPYGIIRFMTKPYT